MKTSTINITTFKYVNETNPNSVSNNISMPQILQKKNSVLMKDYKKEENKERSPSKIKIQMIKQRNNNNNTDKSESINKLTNSNIVVNYTKKEDSLQINQTIQSKKSFLVDNPNLVLTTMKNNFDKFSEMVGANKTKPQTESEKKTNGDKKIQTKSKLPKINVSKLNESEIKQEIEEVIKLPEIKASQVSLNEKQNSIPDVIKKKQKQFNEIHSKNINFIKSMVNKQEEKINIRSHSQESVRQAPVKKMFYKREKEEKLQSKVEIDTDLYYTILPQNNGELVKSCMSHRTNWKESNSALYHFRWQQNRNGIDYPGLSKFPSQKQIVNHFEYHSQLSNKLNLFINMVKYCESKGLDVFQYLPMTILVQYDAYNYVRQFDRIKEFFNLLPQFVNNDTPTGEVSGASSVKNHSKTYKYTDYFNFSFGSNDRTGSKSPLYIQKTHFSGKNLWLVKAIDLNRGRCIKICDSIEKIELFVKNFYTGIEKSFNSIVKKDEEDISPEKSDKLGKVYEQAQSLSPTNRKSKKSSLSQPMSKTYKSSTVVLQKYIENPLLYNNRKFDIRLWVLLTHKLDVYVFKEGHLKACSVNYDLTKIDEFIHLTNYSVQKYNEHFAKYEEGNEISFKDFQLYLDKFHNQSGVSVSILMNKMIEIIKITMLAVTSKINIFNRNFCFEVFGYDFILDSDFKPFLLEINTNPGLEESSTLIKQLVPRMIDDALRLTIDTVHATKYAEDGGKYKSPYSVPEYTNEENLFQLICNIKSQPQNGK
jgi:hypothetical protein